MTLGDSSRAGCRPYSDKVMVLRYAELDFGNWSALIPTAYQSVRPRPSWPVFYGGNLLVAGNDQRVLIDRAWSSPCFPALLPSERIVNHVPYPDVAGEVGEGQVCFVPA